jgi:hypothetical protein
MVGGLAELALAGEKEAETGVRLRLARTKLIRSAS